MGLAWKGLIPLAMLNLVFLAVFESLGWHRWPLAVLSVLLFVAAGYWSALQAQSFVRKASVA
jgi:hypothetical protein